MARNSSGTHSLPAGNPVVTGTTISSSVHNATLSDISTEITASLDRSGRGPMLAPLELTDGTVALPSLSFDSDTDNGLYRAAANTPAMSAGGVQAQKWESTGATFPLVATFSNGLTATGDEGVDGAGVTGTGSTGAGAGGVFTGGTGGGMGVTAAGNADQPGIQATGGATGVGVRAIGGGTSGNGVTATATSGYGVHGTGAGSNSGVHGIGGTNSAGVTGAGTGSGAGGSFTGGATGIGVIGTGGANGNAGGSFAGTVNSMGVSATGAGTGDGVFAQSAVGGTGHGVEGVSLNSTGAGVKGEGSGAGPGGEFESFTGYGVITTGNATRANLRIVPQSAEPSSAQNGDLYYDSDTDKLMLRAAGAWVALN